MPVETFQARIYRIGVNPYVLFPARVLKIIFRQAQKTKGPIPVRGEIDGHLFLQTLVKYSGKWRLYINTTMRKASNRKLGEMVTISIEYDPVARIIPLHKKLDEALKRNPKARKVFDNLSPSRRKEIVRYISSLKTESSVERNVERAIRFLLQKTRFVGRDNPMK